MKTIKNLLMSQKIDTRKFIKRSWMIQTLRIVKPIDNIIRISLVTNRVAQVALQKSSNRMHPPDTKKIKLSRNKLIQNSKKKDHLRMKT